MDLFNAMKVFLAVAESSGFSAASQQLDISVPSVTRIVAQLEERLGTRLFQRSTRHVTLTPAGEEYVTYAKNILEAVALAHAAVQNHTVLHRGTLRIGCLPSLAEHWIAPLYPSFHAAYPEINLDVHVDTHPLVNLAQYDVALLRAREGKDSTVIARSLFSSDGILCAAPHYLHKYGTPTLPENLSHHRCLLRRTDGLNGGHIQLWHPGQCMTSPPEFQGKVQPSLTINHTSSLLRVTLDGSGIAAFSQDIVAPHLAQGSLVHVLPQWITGRFAVLAALPSRRHLPARTQVFLDFLSAHGRELHLNHSRL